MKSTDNRRLFGTLIGASAAAGDIATIPATQGKAGDGTASIALAFPPETFIARAAGGEPPRGADMNGFLNLLSSAVQVLQAGYLGPFDANFAAGIGGYPAGAVVSGSTAGTFWVSTADSNTTVPGATGAMWQSLFYGLAKLSGGNSFSGSQVFNDAVTTIQHHGSDASGGTRWGGYVLSQIAGYAYNAAKLYVCEVVDDHVYANLEVNGNGTIARTDFAFRLDTGRIQTTINVGSSSPISQVVAWQSDVTSAVSSEATARQTADTSLSNAISAETSRAEAAEALKANLSGGNSFTGNQSVVGEVAVSSHCGSDTAGSLRWGGYLSGNILGYTYNNYNLYMCEVVGTDPYVTLEVNYNGTNAVGGSGRSDFTFHGPTGRIGTILGNCAVMSDVQAETTRATTAENNLQSSKVNRDGDTMIGPLTLNAGATSTTFDGSNTNGSLRWGGYFNSAITGSQANGSLYLAEIVGSETYYDLQINSGASRTDFKFHQNGSIESTKGLVAFTSDLPLPDGMHVQIFTVTIPAGTRFGYISSPYVAALPTAFSTFSYAHGSDTGNGVFTVSASPANNSYVNIWAQSPQNQGGANSAGSVVLTIFAYGYY